jgi:hypothetical protein
MNDFDVTEAKVTYTTKELLLRIDQRFERLEQMAQNAPTRIEVDHIDTRVASLESEAITLRATAEALKGERIGRWTRNEKVYIAITTFVMVVLNVFSLSGGPHIFK